MTLDEMKIIVTAQTAEAEKAIDGVKNKMGTVDGSNSKLMGGFSKLKVAGLAAATAIGTALLKVGKDSFKAAADYEQLSGGIEKLYGKSSAQVEQYASNAYKTCQMSANQYMETSTAFAASLLQATNGNTAKAAKASDMAMRDMADNVSVFGTKAEDVQNAYKGFAKQNYTMLDNLKLGYGGTKTEMERLLADAEKITGKKYDISNFQDVAEALHVIQKEQGLTGNAAEEASHTVQGSIDTMKASWQNWLAALGSGDSSKISKTTTQMMDSVKNVMKNAIPVVGNIAKGLLESAGKAFEQLPSLISENLPKLTAKINEFADNLGNGDFDGHVFKIIGKIIAAIVKNLPQLVLALARLAVEAGAAFIRSLGSAIGSGVKHVFGSIGTKAKNAMGNLWAAVKEKFMAIVNGVKSIPGKIAAKFKKLGSKISKAMGNLWSAVKKKFTNIVSKVASIPGKIAGKFKSLGKKISRSMGSLWGAVKAKFTSMVNGVKSIPGKIANKFSGIVGKIKSKFSGLRNIMSSIGISLPHIHVSGGKAPWGIAGKGTKPSFSVTWGAKGGILDSAQLIGAGEAGKEALLPLERNTGWMDSLGARLASYTYGGEGSDGSLTVNVEIGGTSFGHIVIDSINEAMEEDGIVPLSI